jgi:hypothetical protein
MGGFGNPGGGDGSLLDSPGAGGASPEASFMQKFAGYTDGEGQQSGWGSTAVKSLAGLSSLYFGMKQYGLAKDSFKENKRQFDMNFGAQQKMVNSDLEDRQRARVASNPNAYQSVGTYLDKNAV